MERLLGRPVADAMGQRLKDSVCDLRKSGVEPTMLIVRVGERPDDISYQRGATKCCEEIGICVRTEVFSENVSEDEFVSEFEKAANDEAVHGVLLLHPLPRHIDLDKVKAVFPRKKDVDCMLNRNLGRLFTGDPVSPPCTAQAVIEILRHYNIPLCGRHAVIIGRSMVVGKPLSQLLLSENATVTVCHSRTADMQKITKSADIVVTAVGRAKMFDKEYFTEGQTVIDVGINVDENGSLCGDVDYDDVKDVVAAITPVPGGAGVVTTRVLAQNLIESCIRQQKES